MDDLISRQDAVKSMTNAIWHYPNEMYAQLNSYEMAEALAKDGLMFIPSAQQWIPCSERLPEEFKRVLCCTDKEEMFLACVYIFDNGYTFDNEERMMWDGDVVAWMPLPEPYKGGDE